MLNQPRNVSRAPRQRIGGEAAELVADKATNFTRIDVDTTNHVVSLTGMVESPEQKARARQIAMDVSGVRRVDNN